MHKHWISIPLICAFLLWIDTPYLYECDADGGACYSGIHLIEWKISQIFDSRQERDDAIRQKLQKQEEAANQMYIKERKYLVQPMYCLPPGVSPDDMYYAADRYHPDPEILKEKP